MSFFYIEILVSSEPSMCQYTLCAHTENMFGQSTATAKSETFTLITLNSWYAFLNTSVIMAITTRLSKTLFHSSIMSCNNDEFCTNPFPSIVQSRSRSKKIRRGFPHDQTFETLWPSNHRLLEKERISRGNDSSFDLLPQSEDFGYQLESSWLTASHNNIFLLFSGCSLFCQG